MRIIKRNGAEVGFDITKIIICHHQGQRVRGGGGPDDAGADPADRGVRGAAVSEDEPRPPPWRRSRTWWSTTSWPTAPLRWPSTTSPTATPVRWCASPNTTDDKILSLIECNNEEAKQENSNKNPVVNSTQRDYMAGEVSRDITNRILLPRTSWRPTTRALSTSTTPIIMPSICTTATW